MNAAKNGHVTAMEALLAKGANIEASDNYGRTPLLWAVGSGHIEAVEATDNNGLTPLHLAAIKHNALVIEFLISKGANVEAINDFGETPLHLAAQEDQSKAIEVLLVGAQI